MSQIGPSRRIAAMQFFGRNWGHSGIGMRWGRKARLRMTHLRHRGPKQQQAPLALARPIVPRAASLRGTFRGNERAAYARDGPFDASWRTFQGGCRGVAARQGVESR